MKHKAKQPEFRMGATDFKLIPETGTDFDKVKAADEKRKIDIKLSESKQMKISMQDNGSMDIQFRDGRTGNLTDKELQAYVVWKILGA